MNNRSIGIDRLARARMIREREDLEKGLLDWGKNIYEGYKWNQLDPTQQNQMNQQMADIVQQKNQNLPPDQQMAIPQGKQGYQNMMSAARKGQRSEQRANQMMGQLQQAAGGQQAQGQQQAAGGQQGGGNNPYAQQHAQLLAQQAQGQPKAQGGIGYNPMTMLATGGLSAIAQAGKNFFTNQQNKKQQQQAMGQLAERGQQGGGQPQQQQAPAPAGAPAPPAPPAGAPINPSIPLPPQESVPLPAPGGAANDPPASAAPAGAPAPAGVPVPTNPEEEQNQEEQVTENPQTTKSRPFWNIDMLDSADRIYKGMDYLRYRK